MDDGVRYARNGEVDLAYETFGDLASGEPLLLIMGLDFQMVWWPDGFCQALADGGFAVARFDNRDTGLSTHLPASGRERPWRALRGRAAPMYTARDMVIAGQADPLFRAVSAGRELAARIPRAELVTYGGMGHNLPEQLWPDVIDRTCQVVRRWGAAG